MPAKHKPTVPSPIHILIGWLYAIAILFLISAGTVWLIHSPYFPVQHINIIKSDGGTFARITRQELLDAKNDSITGNIFQINLNHIKARFERIPWVRHAEVGRIWPDTVTVRISERFPVARWNDHHLLDQDGQIFTATDEHDLPLFYGPRASERTMVETYAQIAPLLAHEQLQIKRLIYSDRFAWQLELDNKITVKLGRDDTVRRINRFTTYWQSTLKAQAAQLSYVDMRYTNGFAIKLKDGTTPSNAD